MNRSEALARLANESFDVLVIGGGATGLGVAVDAASRGYCTALIESHDFAQATSSRSTKLVHGGVRYLQQFDFSLVIEALRERGRLLRNAPHLVHGLPFVIPRYKWWEGVYYGLGLKLYDLLAGRLGIGRSKRLNPRQTIEAIPNVRQQGLRGGTLYYDGQFDDARLAISLARTAFDRGAALANYCPAVRLIKQNGRVTGTEAEDCETGSRFEIRAAATINATGVFTDSVRRMDDQDAREIIEPAQGVHVVLDGSFGPGDHALMIPRTTDGRVLFAIPWHGRTLVGTTDTPIPQPQHEPRPLPEEIDFILHNAGRYLQRQPTCDDVLSVFAGLRPLVHKGGRATDTKSISRSHEILVSDSRLVTITGGKWTTYRQMAEETVDRTIKVAELPHRQCKTKDLQLHGFLPTSEADARQGDHLLVYGSDEAQVRHLAEERPELGQPIHPQLPYLGAEVVWAARHEMVRTLEDVLSRRTRALVLDARAALEAAPVVCELLAAELGRDAEWQERQLATFQDLASGFLLN